jgi:hypothetical protein
MNYLRKHQKAILAILGVVCMITFVLGPFLLDLIDMSGSGGNRSDDPVVVTWVGGKVRRSELALKQQMHQIAVNFLRELIAEVVERGGQPVINGQTIPKETPRIQIMQIDPGIGGDAHEYLIVRMMLLARKGDELGVVVDQQAAREFVESLSIPDVQPEEWRAILTRATPPGMSMSIDQLLAQIAFDLKANHVQHLMQAGLMSVTPGEAWEYHNRLNRRFVIEAYPVDVAGFGAQVQGEPTDDELRALFEKGKSDDPNPSIAEPGFHVPHKIAFQWLRIDRGPFVEAAMKKITDEQVAKQYELDITQGKHKVLELPGDPTRPGESAPPSDPNKPTDPAKPTDPTKPDEAAKPDDSKQPGEAKPDDAKPAAENTPDKAAEKPAEDKPVAEKSENSAPENSAAEKPCGQEPSVQETKPAGQPAETKPEEAKPAESNPAAAAPGEAAPQATSPPTTTPPVSPAPPPKYKPLEEVKDDIRRELAQPLAEDAIKEALKKAIDEINAYGRKYRRWRSAQEAIQEGVKTAKAEDPGKLDVEGIAARFGFQAGSTGLVDRHEIGNFEIGQKVMEIDMEAIRMGQFRQLSFADLAYGASDVLYSPNSEPVSSTEPDVSFIFWRTAEEEAKDPTFDEVREQLVQAWKFAKAFELAKAEAQKLADKAKGAESLKTVVADPTKVVQTIPFSWLTTGSLAFGSGMPSLSTVPGIDLAGTEFMEGVFRLKPGEAGVAPNRSHRTVYVVRVVSQEPTDDVLREQFLESGLNMQVRMVARNELMRTSFEMFDGLDKEMELVWERPPVELAGR